MFTGRLVCRGAGDPTAGRAPRSARPAAASAASASTRPYARLKPTGTALDSSACSTAVFVRSGLAEKSRPARPATTGAAPEVPPTGPYPGAPFRVGQAVMFPSGAATLTHEP